MKKTNRKTLFFARGKRNYLCIYWDTADRALVFCNRYDSIDIPAPVLPAVALIPVLVTSLVKIATIIF